jgi:hypothetical protein
MTAICLPDKPNIPTKVVREKTSKPAMCFCQSYYSDDNELVDCTCGKCDKPMQKPSKMGKPMQSPPVVTEEEMTDMFGEGGKEEVKEAYTPTHPTKSWEKDLETRLLYLDLPKKYWPGVKDFIQSVRKAGGVTGSPKPKRVAESTADGSPTDTHKREEWEKEFDKAFTNRLLKVTDSPSKDWEDGYNTMVEATRLWMMEAKDFIQSVRTQAIEEERERVRKETPAGTNHSRGVDKEIIQPAGEYDRGHRDGALAVYEIVKHCVDYGWTIENAHRNIIDNFPKLFLLAKLRGES